jgi:hypothetical protein
MGSDRAQGSNGSPLTPESLLTRAAITGVRARAGFTPRKIETRIPSCPPDHKPVAPSAAADRLKQLFIQSDAGLIGEWIALARGHGVRAADADVPALLGWLASHARRDAAAYEVVGSRGVWLAALNPQWTLPHGAGGMPVDIEAVWQTGTAQERAAVLATVRLTHPARARAIVESTWKSDSADERRSFSLVLHESPTIDDEPFFERALDDKSKHIRAVAAMALIRIPGSAFRARMDERLRACIVVEGKRGVLKRRPQVTLSSPTAFDKAWERDGIEEQAASGKGKRAWWLRQIIASTGLSVWTEATELDPAGVCQAIAKDGYAHVAFDALIEVAARERNAGLSRALLDHALASDSPDVGLIATLWTSLPHPDNETLALAALPHQSFRQADRWRIFATLDRPWSEAFSERALAALAAGSRPQSGPVAWELNHFMEPIARVVAPSVADAFGDVVRGHFKDEPPPSVTSTIHLARIRAEMHKEFGS